MRTKICDPSPVPSVSVLIVMSIVVTVESWRMSMSSPARTSEKTYSESSAVVVRPRARRMASSAVAVVSGRKCSRYPPLPEPQTPPHGFSGPVRVPSGRGS